MSTLRRIINAAGKLSWTKKACAVLVLCAMPMAVPAQTITTVHDFNGPDGYAPSGPLVEDNGIFYGTTTGGGAGGGGTVFKITPAGTLVTLYEFCAQTKCENGWSPSSLVRGNDGNFYGTTVFGGVGGSGTVFKISPQGVVTLIYSFCVTGCNNGIPSNAGPLILAKNGNFYGTTGGGGANAVGTVFEVSPTGKFTTLYNFCSVAGCADGALGSGIIQGTDGNFYGTTLTGGDLSNPQCPSTLGCGTVFKMTPSGVLTTLHTFLGIDGIYPQGPLVEGRNENFYGTTGYGGTGDCGTVFEITARGSFTSLHNFQNHPDGCFPAAPLLQGADGSFYGGTNAGGQSYNSGGTVFELTPTGLLGTLYDFCSETNCQDGASPSALVKGMDGSFYGATAFGGTNTACQNGLGCGTIFKLVPDSTQSFVANCGNANDQTASSAIAGSCGITKQGPCSNECGAGHAQYYSETAK